MEKIREKIFYKKIENGAYIIAFASIFPAKVRQHWVYNCLENISRINKVYENTDGRIKITIFKSPDNFIGNRFASLEGIARDKGIPQSPLEFELSGCLDEKTYQELEKTLRKDYADEFMLWKTIYAKKTNEYTEKETKQEKPLKRKR